MPNEKSTTRTIPENFQLNHGSHNSFEVGACAMELVAWLADEQHSDHPLCSCPVLGAFARSWNDALGDDARNRLLLPMVPRLVGTKSTPEVEEKRAWMATDWLIRVCTPAFLELTPSLREHARALSGLPPVISREVAESSAETIRSAWTAAGDAARAAAGDAAWTAARAAARAAAWTAARAAAGDAAGDAAWTAAGDALQSTVEKLQQSALQLLSDMIEEK